MTWLYSFWKSETELFGKIPRFIPMVLMQIKNVEARLYCKSRNVCGHLISLFYFKNRVIVRVNFCFTIKSNTMTRLQTDRLKTIGCRACAVPNNLDTFQLNFSCKKFNLIKYITFWNTVLIINASISIFNCFV